MDLIRGIVLAIRNHEGRPSAGEVHALVSNEDNGIFGYHMQLLLQGVLVTGVDTGVRKDRYGLAILALTWTSQDFADNITNDDAWASAHQTLSEAGLESASFAVWSQIVATKITELCGGALVLSEEVVCRFVG
ncbi:Hypothetical protein SAMN06265222_102376 [Neorhodopirellula lusitana]|uniref:Uncharacterized protein n=1 Tax=Neorhodopirellula lusitana TaxID=445327 RepID=A0ABY1PV65_9BACT|nr:DUF2513 domain-containing protein [Neorhodopirellula lusitana]SMP48050.1 Hypothetical protein SAMN06265222_102376 [Neorhodopirellula lusitana]